MKGSGPAQSRWWTEKDPSGALFTSVGAIDRQHGFRRRSLLDAYRYYGDTMIAGFGPGEDVDCDAVPPLSFNVIRSITDTVHAETVQSQPRAQFSSTGAGWEARQRCDKLTQFVSGVEYACEADETNSAVCRDAILFGAGIEKIFDDEDEVAIERVLPGELYVDAYDAREGKPRSMYQVKHIDRARLEAQYPDKAAAVAGATSEAEWMRSWGMTDTNSDLVVVIEAWHLPSTKKSKDGRHVISTRGGVLVDEKWEEQTFPFAILRWAAPVIGFWPNGAAEQLAGVQYDINSLLDKIREHQDNFGSGFFLCEDGSEPRGHNGDEVGRCVTFKQGRMPPTVVTPQTVSRDTYEQLDRYYAKAYEIFGVSAMAAQSVKPAGVDSGKAMRTLAMIQSKRFIAFGQAWERFCLTRAKMIVRCARRIAERVPSFTVVYQDSEQTVPIDWSECDLDDDEFVVRAFPVSALQGTPAEKLATASDMLANGAIDSQQWARLIGQPDIKAAMQLNDAPHDLIEKLLSKMVVENKFISPEPFFDLASCYSLGVKAYNKAIGDDVPEDRLDLLRAWIEQTKALQEAAAPPPAPPAVESPMSPPPMPGDAPPPLPPMAA